MLTRGAFGVKVGNTLQRTPEYFGISQIQIACSGEIVVTTSSNSEFAGSRTAGGRIIASLPDSATRPLALQRHFE